MMQFFFLFHHELKMRLEIMDGFQTNLPPSKISDFVRKQIWENLISDYFFLHLLCLTLIQKAKSKCSRSNIWYIDSCFPLIQIIYVLLCWMIWLRARIKIMYFSWAGGSISTNKWIPKSSWHPNRQLYLLKVIHILNSKYQVSLVI